MTAFEMIKMIADERITREHLEGMARLLKINSIFFDEWTDDQLFCQIAHDCETETQLSDLLQEVDLAITHPQPAHQVYQMHGPIDGTLTQIANAMQ